ncbi:MAG: hypothetical protein IKO43_02715 [Kiritimatiellae bacterium]|nr:hypothetical protein [Kiritimatiellia bacterium]
MSSLNVRRTTEPLQFNTGIGEAKYAEIFDSPVPGEPQRVLLPGTTTVSQALDAIFPQEVSVSGEVMRAMVASNTAALRTSSGFNAQAREAVDQLRSLSTDAGDRAAREIENLLADTDLFEHYRLALLET